MHFCPFYLQRDYQKQKQDLTYVQKYIRTFSFMWVNRTDVAQLTLPAIFSISPVFLSDIL